MRRGIIVAAFGLFAGQVLGQTDDTAGSAAFEANCSACHNTGGIGTPGLAPPLDRPEFWQGLGDTAPNYIAHVVSHGLNLKLKVRANTYLGVFMPPVAGASDDDLADATTWVLQTLGKTDLSVSAKEIGAARSEETSNQDLAEMRAPGAEAEK